MPGLADPMYTQTFKSQAGSTWTIDLIDQTGPGQSRTFNSDSAGFTLSYIGNGDDRNQCIKSSEVTINCLVEDSTFETFLTGMVGASETRYLCQIKKEGVFYWGGILVTDLIQLEDRPKPYNVTLTFADALGRLAAIPYMQTDDLFYEGYETFPNIIAKILNKTGQQVFYSTTETFMRISFNWFDTIQTTVTRGMMELFRVDQLVFTEKAGDEKKALNCLEVLQNILNTFFLRIYQVDGIWYIDHINEITKNIYYRSYRKTGVYITTAANSREIAGTNFKRFNGLFSFFKPLRSATATYDYKTGLATSMLPAQEQYEAEVDCGSIYGPFVDPYPVIKHTGRLATKITWAGSPFVRFKAKFKLTIKLRKSNGTYLYLFGDTSASEPVYTWRSTPGYVTFYSGVKFKTGTIVDAAFEIITPDITELVDISYKFEPFGYVDLVGDPYTLPETMSFLYWCQDFKLNALLSDGTIYENGSQVFEGVQQLAGVNTTALSASIDLDPTILGDGPLDFNTGCIFANNNVNTNWLSSSEWSVNQYATVGVNIASLKILEFMIGQLTPTRQFIGNLKFTTTTLAKMHQWATIDGAKMIFNSLSLNAGSDEYDVEMFECDVDRNDYGDIEVTSITQDRAPVSAGFDYILNLILS